MKLKAQILDSLLIDKSLMRISYEIIETHQDLSNVVLVGVKTRGIPLANRIKNNINKLTNDDIPVYSLDVSKYRDDLDRKVKKDKLDFDPTGKEIILIDDVLFTGRTTRACMDAILENGRAEKIKLAVLIDRGHRDLPIKADYVGKNVPTKLSEKITVNLEETDNETNVLIYE